MNSEEQFESWWKIKNYGASSAHELLAIKYGARAAWFEATRQAYEDAVRICKYREDLQIRAYNESRANEARCCAEAIQARMKELMP